MIAARVAEDKIPPCHLYHLYLIYPVEPRGNRAILIIPIMTADLSYFLLLLDDRTLKHLYKIPEFSSRLVEAA